eukprot:97394_1
MLSWMYASTVEEKDIALQNDFDVDSILEIEEKDALKRMETIKQLVPKSVRDTLEHLKLSKYILFNLYRSFQISESEVINRLKTEWKNYLSLNKPSIDANITEYIHNNKHNVWHSFWNLIFDSIFIYCKKISDQISRQMFPNYSDIQLVNSVNKCLCVCTVLDLAKRTITKKSNENIIIMLLLRKETVINNVNLQNILNDNICKLDIEKWKQNGWEDKKIYKEYCIGLQKEAQKSRKNFIAAQKEAQKLKRIYNLNVQRRRIYNLNETKSNNKSSTTEISHEASIQEMSHEQMIMKLQNVILEKINENDKCQKLLETKSDTIQSLQKQLKHTTQLKDSLQKENEQLQKNNLMQQTQVNQFKNDMKSVRFQLDETTQANLRQQQTILALQQSTHKQEEEEKKMDNKEKCLSKVAIDLNNEIETFKQKYNQQKLKQIYNKTPKELIQNNSAINTNIKQYNNNNGNIMRS